MAGSAQLASPRVPKSAWWRPTLADAVVILLCLWAFVITPGGAAGLLSDANAGMHIRTGDLIRATGTVPHTDPFSYSRAGQPWFAWEWLTAVLFSLLHQAFGLPGIGLLGMLLVGATFAILLRTSIRAGGVALIVIPLIFVAFRISSLHFLARPHLFTWLFLAVTVAVVEADRAATLGRRIWWLVPLSALWANMHGGFPILSVYLGLATVGFVFEQNAVAAWRYGKLAGATAIATLANPYGWAVHRHIWEMLNSQWLSEMVQEFQPPWTMSDERIYLYYALAGLGAVAAVGLAVRRNFVGPLVIAGFLYLSLQSIRHIPLFLIATLPPVASYYSSLWKRWAGLASRKSTVAILDALSRDRTPQLASLSLAGLILASAGFALPGHFGVPQDFSEKVYPIRMIAAHRRQLAQGRLLTHDGWADYLEYHGFPDQKVWVDGRGDFFGPQFGRQYFALMDAEPPTEAILAEWRFDTILIRPSQKLATWLKGRREWREVARDKQAVLFVRTN